MEERENKKVGQEMVNLSKLGSLFTQMGHHGALLTSRRLLI